MINFTALPESRGQNLPDISLGKIVGGLDKAIDPKYIKKGAATVMELKRGQVTNNFFMFTFLKNIIFIG